MSQTDNQFREFYGAYLSAAHSCLDTVEIADVQAVVDALWEAYKSRKRVYVAGNGGSAANAIHFACCLSQGTMVEGKPPLRAESLLGNTCFLTAVANDNGFEHVFHRQLQTCLEPGDAFIALSCSGNSPNVVSAMEYAQKIGAHTIAFLGFAGGLLKQLAQHTVYVENYNYGQVETLHLHLAHLISQQLKQRIMES